MSPLGSLAQTFSVLRIPAICRVLCMLNTTLLANIIIILHLEVLLAIVVPIGQQQY